MRRLTIFVLLFCLPWVSFAGQVDWHSYSSEDGAYQVRLPAEPTATVEEKDSGMSYKVMARDNEVVYFVAATAHTTALDDGDPHELAQTSVESFAENVGGVALSESDWKVGKHMGRGATIYVASQAFTMEYRAVLIGQLQYQVVAAGPADFLDEKTVKKFIKSFRPK